MTSRGAAAAPGVVSVTETKRGMEPPRSKLVVAVNRVTEGEMGENLSNLEVVARTLPSLLLAAACSVDATEMMKSSPNF
jgi:hypothetical protein